MADDAEQQAEEIEVLKSIYEGDENFKQCDPKTYQYKYIDGEKSFVMEISWGPTYPTDKPKVNLEIFYNQHLLPSVKEKILSVVNTEAEQWLGCAMTYTLFECLKEKVPELLAEQTEEVVVSSRVEKIILDDNIETTKKPEKKEHLTKAQKRRAWDKAELGRGGGEAEGLGLGGYSQTFVPSAPPARPYLMTMTGVVTLLPTAWIRPSGRSINLFVSPA